MKIPRAVRRAAEAALGKLAMEPVVLDVQAAASFTDHFLILSAGNPRQMVAVADAVMEALREAGHRPRSREGYPHAEWILLDYGDFVVHVFTPRMRSFYDLERLWGGVPRVELLK